MCAHPQGNVLHMYWRPASAAAYAHGFTWYTPGTMRWVFAPSSSASPQASVCMLCGAWLPLGESNDDPEAVLVEIEAARLAAHLAHGDFPDDEPEDEWADYGWASHATQSDVYEGTWHGWLAREISAHEEKTGEVK